MAFVIPAPSLPALPVVGSDGQFPIRRVHCVGKNYADHVREMGGDPERNPPFFFGKPSDAVVPLGGEIAYPPMTSNLHHEVELVVALGGGGRNIAAENALDCVYGYAVGIDLTRRDLQAKFKDKGQPWEMAKGFDQSAPVSAVMPASRCGHPASGVIWLAVDGVDRQRGDLGQMTWNVAEVIAHLSAYVALAPGDLIFTGTPSGVGALVRGNHVTCGIQGIGDLAITLI